MKKLFRRLNDILVNPAYRRVLVARVLMTLLSKVNKGIRYVGFESHGETTFLFTHDVTITPYTLSTGGFQREDFLTVLDLCQKEGYPLGQTFVDVGANIGTQTIYALSSGKFAKALCFEPARANQRLLKINMTANEFEDRVTLVRAAVSDAEGTLALKLSSSNSGDHRVSRESADASETIPAVTLDGALRANGLTPANIGLLWIDTQGHEAMVLGGASAILTAGVPTVLEFWPEGLHASGSYERLLRQMQESFASFYDLSERAPQKRSTRDLPAYVATLFSASLEHTDFLLIK